MGNLVAAVLSLIVGAIVIGMYYVFKSADNEEVDDWHARCEEMMRTEFRMSMENHILRSRLKELSKGKDIRTKLNNVKFRRQYMPRKKLHK